MSVFAEWRLARDIRLAARALRRTPVFALVTIGSLALALALSAGMISVTNAYSIRALPYPEPERLYHVMYAPPGPWEPRGMPELDWTSVADVVEYPIAAASDSISFTEGGYAVLARGRRATRGFMAGLGVQPVVGRGFTDADFISGSEHVALIGYSMWRDRFGSDPSVIGRVLHGDPESRPGSRETFHIVGVLPPGFYFGRDSTATIDVLIPESARVRAYMVRLRPGISQAVAERRITEAVRRAATSPIPADWPGAQLESVYARYVGSLQPVLTVLTVAVALVLAIVCANVGVLMLLRSIQRQKETAVRLALGSTRRDLARMFLTEALILMAVALVIGVGLSTLLLTTLSPIIQAQLGRPAPRSAGITIDASVLSSVAAAGLLIAIVVSCLPLVTPGRGLMSVLRHDGRVATDSRSTRRLRQMLIAAEIAASLVLLIGCGLMVRSVSQMLRTDLGFDPTGISRSRVMLKAGKYPDAAAFSRFHDALGTRVAEANRSPVVFSSWPPYVEAPSRTIETDGASAAAGNIAVSPRYFELFKIAIRQGRAFERGDLSTPAAVAIVSDTLARRLWPQGGGLGRRVRLIDQTPDGPATGPWQTIVGIAGDVRQSYDDRDRADFYTPKIPDGRYSTFYLRTRTSQPTLFAELRATAAAIDVEAVVSEPHVLSADDRMLSGATFMALLLTGFALAAVCLAMLGIYGVTAYAVEQRGKEVAIRMALGASPGAVVRMFLRGGSLLVGSGTASGLVGGWLLSRVLRQQVLGVHTVDALTYSVAAALLIAAGLFAVWWPARRAAAVHPARTLNAG